MQYAEVLVDARATRRSFHYDIPAEILPLIRQGSFVRVPFRRREVDGIVVSLTNRLPRGIGRAKLRSIRSVVEPAGVLSRTLFSLAEWMANYYLSSFADALFTMLPPFPKRPQLRVQLESTKSQAKKAFYFIRGREGERWQRYQAAIDKILSKHQRALVLFPNRQRAERFLEKLSTQSGIRSILYSADLPRARRFRTWERILAGDFEVVIGTRIAIFAPVPQLGLIILDEDPHPGFKEEQHPRYHAREVALVRAALEGATFVNGNLIPTLSTFQGIRRSRIKVIETPLREVQTTLIDARAQKSILSPTIEEMIAKADRAIIFTTRLGVGGATRCLDCQHLFSCANCTLPLTLHKGSILRCHHCGQVELLPLVCPICQGSSIRSTTSGTEGLEEYIAQRFPDRKVKILEASQPDPGEWQIMVSTVKILDTTYTAPVVAVSSLDSILELPDPFALERAAQLLVQLRARATQSFLVQTRLPDHRVFRVLEDPEGYLDDELHRRRIHGYPPTLTLVRVLSRDRDLEKARGRVKKLADVLKRKLTPKEATILGPGPAFFERLRGEYRWHLLIKMHSRDRKIRAKLRSLLPDDVAIDVNPVDIL